MNSHTVADYLGNSLKITVPDENKPYRPRMLRIPTVKLPSGFDMPLIGLGTWKIPPSKTKNVVLAALHIGYRYIDTAHSYGNEAEVGDAINTWLTDNICDRDELFIASKLPVYGNRPEDVEKYLLDSLVKLQLTYVDLYLMHMPFALKPNNTDTGPLTTVGGNIEMEPIDHDQIWAVFQRLLGKGLAKSIGLSNFNEDQLIRIVNLCKAGPDNLQIELNVALQQRTIVATCQQLHISLTASAPLGSPDSVQHYRRKYNHNVPELNLLNNDVVKRIAASHNKTPAQVLLKFLVQQKIAVIPKSTNSDRLRENFEIFDFELSKNDMNYLKALEQGEPARICTFLHYKGVEDHEEYPF